MTATVDWRTSVGIYLEMAIRGDATSAVRHALDLLGRGVTTETVILDLFAAAQHESGERWLRNEWSVADEHVVSGVTQRALDAVANTVDQPVLTGSVVVACAEGDWHSLPAQMGAEVLRSRGFAVSFLGASTPADHVTRILVRDRPDVLVVTCNLPLFFSGVSRLADAAHRVGVPVMAGGRALPSLQRAARLGADGWAPDITAASDRLVEQARPSAPGIEPTALNMAALQLDVDSTHLASHAFESMTAAHPFMRRYTDEQGRRTREDLAFIVRFVAAAVLVDDPTVFTEFLGWLRPLLAARDVPPDALHAGLEALIPLIADVDAAAGKLTHSAAKSF